MRFGIVAAEWNSEITESLLQAAVDTLEKYGAKRKNIIKKYVPGSFELPLGAQLMAEQGIYNAVICLGCVIQGETRHFEFISGSAAQGIQDVGLKYNLPVIFGVLTPNNLQQAQERSGGKLGNKGAEAAVTAIKMAYLKDILMK